jgi:hypothetical protein
VHRRCAGVRWHAGMLGRDRSLECSSLILASRSASRRWCSKSQPLGTALGIDAERRGQYLGRAKKADITRSNRLSIVATRNDMAAPRATRVRTPCSPNDRADAAERKVET